MALFVLSMTSSAHSAVQLYTGRMEILVTSGKSCEGLAGTHDVSLVYKEEGGSGGLSGYFVGSGITIGKFSGSDPGRLDVRYPFQDELRASGHIISISRTDSNLTAELHDRHVDAAADDCNFDLAQLELTRSVNVDASARLVQMSGLFDAQMARSQALALVQTSGYAAALPHFERALVLADSSLEKGSDQINSYLVGLATSYIWLDRFDDFNRLFDTRIMTMQDESLRSIFSGYRVRTLLNEGRSLLGREEYEPALSSFQQAYKLQPQNRDVIAAVMSVYVRSGRYADAVSFLERSEPVLVDEVDRRDIRTATAMVLYKKAQKDDKAGNIAEAEVALKRAMELDPGSVYILIARARLLHKTGNLADAERLLDQGMVQFTGVQSKNEISAARDRIHQLEMILKKIRKVDS
jgi:tetratricopeptide (TPR) repeat protein